MLQSILLATVREMFASQHFSRNKEKLKYKSFNGTRNRDEVQRKISQDVMKFCFRQFIALMTSLFLIQEIYFLSQNSNKLILIIRVSCLAFELIGNTTIIAIFFKQLPLGKSENLSVMHRNCSKVKDKSQHMCLPFQRNEKIRRQMWKSGICIARYARLSKVRNCLSALSIEEAQMPSNTTCKNF